VPSIEELKEQQRRQWTGNAGGWDAMHERLERETRPVTEWLCDEARLKPGMRVLDLACGSGLPALEIAVRVAPGGSVVATDLVPEMVEATQRRAQEIGIANVEARVIDAEDIGFPDEAFDAVTCRFGIMFCPQPDVALREIRRVLKPEGRLTMSVWADPKYSPGQTVVGEALRRFGRPQPEPDFEAPGIYQLAPDGKLERFLKDAGFGEVRVERVPVVWDYESQEALWQRQAARSGPLRNLQEELSPEDWQRLQSIFGEVIEPFTDQGRIHIPVTPLCGVAQK
jgi:ubiquinone/menaquinone biosynthesis C-methylase UbiE